MKKVLLSIFAVAALASCFQNEDIVSTSDSNAIKFDSYVGNTTKAIDPTITKATLGSFQVWGTTQGDHTGAAIVPIFTNVNVNDDDGSWAYADEYTQYWIPGNTYNFAAVKNGTVTPGADYLPATIAYSAADQTDLLYAEVNNVTEKPADSKVAFEFQHLLSKAVFTFTNTSTKPENNIYVVENIQISGLDAVAKYNTVTPAWEENTDADYTAVFGNIVKDATNEGAAAAAIKGTALQSNWERLLIPGTYNVTITCTIKLYLNGSYNPDKPKENLADQIDYSYTPAQPITLEKGHSYNFSLKAGLDDQILFDVTKVEGWKKPDTDPTLEQPNHDNN